MREAAAAEGLNGECADRLVRNWDSLQPWDDAGEFLAALGRRRVGVVTNCSDALGRRAAARLGVRFDVIVTSERAGYYKPDPRPYELAIRELALDKEEILFVAGSAFDLVGTARVGLDTYWHNRVGLKRPEQAPAPLREARTLKELFPGA